MSARCSTGGCPTGGFRSGAARSGATTNFSGRAITAAIPATTACRERRLIDEWMTGAQPCWKLAYTGSVGSQSLTGIPVVRQLRDDPRWAGRARIWPFETGLTARRRRRNRLRRGLAVLVAKRSAPTTARRTTRRRCARSPKSSPRATGQASFGVVCRRPDLTEAQRRIVETEEAWTLGVTAPRSSDQLPLRPGGRGSG